MATHANECICCGGQSASPHLPGLLRCNGCGHVWADMQLSGEELRTLYARDYFHGSEYSDYEHEAPALRHNFRKRLDVLRQRHGNGAKLWEIGSAYGYFLAEAKADFEVAGCDISEHASAQAREQFGLNVTAADYLSLSTPAPFDVVCLWDTIEHLAEPHRYLEKAASELRPGGTLALTTGDIGALVPRVRGEKWRLIHPPTHLHYFTSGSMRTLLKRLGFSGITVRHEAVWRSAEATAYLLLAARPNAWTAPFYRAFKAAGMLRFYYPLNTFDVMTVYATK